MNKITEVKIREIRKALGAELLRVRLELGLTREEVLAARGLRGYTMLERIEEGRGNVAMIILSLIAFYKKRIKIELVD